MKKVKNISGKTLTVVDIGVAKPDEIIEVPDNFNNANFEDAGKPSKSEERRKEIQKKDTEEAKVNTETENTEKDKK